MPTEINLYQSYSPSQVVLVEVMDDGSFHLAGGRYAIDITMLDATTGSNPSLA